MADKRENCITIDMGAGLWIRETKSRLDQGLQALGDSPEIG